MLPTSHRRLRSALAAGAAAIVVTSPMTSCTPVPERFGLVNLGDSYSAGVGTGGMTVSTVRPGCYQGQGPDHVSELENHPSIDLLINAACSGLDSAGLRTVVDLPPVADALSRAGVVTLTIGGNDVAWVQTILACSTFNTDAACSAALERAAVAIRVGSESAAAAIAKLASATPGRILMLGYPHLIDPAATGLPITPERAARLNEMTDRLNDALEASAEAGGATFVDVTERFAGHGVGSDQPWINLDLNNLGDANNLHPNQHGYLSGYYPALLDELGLRQA